MLIHAFMTSRLDYCNALLGGCSARLINKLQMVQNAAARLLTRTRKYDHISPVLSTLHCLPIKHCVDFKILLITYKALIALAPQYLSDLLSHYSPPRRAVVKSTFVESKTSPSPKRFESESSPSPKRFESESSPSPKRFESKSKSKSKWDGQNRERKKIFFKTTYLIIDNICYTRDSISSILVIALLFVMI